MKPIIEHITLHLAYPPRYRVGRQLFGRTFPTKDGNVYINSDNIRVESISMRKDGSADMKLRCILDTPLADIKPAPPIRRSVPEGETPSLRPVLAAVRKARSEGILPSVLFLLCLLTSCTQGPTVYTRPDGTLVATTGTRWFNAATDRTLTVTLPNGTILAEHVLAEDNTAVVKAWSNAKLLGTAAAGTKTITNAIKK